MSSVYSQSVTRSIMSTATDESSPIHTPYDEMRRRERGRTSRSQPPTKIQDGIHIRSASNATSSRSAARADRDIGEARENNQGSYFPAVPRKDGNGPGHLSRRGTTKALVGRFEALEEAASSRASLGYGFPPPERRGADVRKSPGGEKKDKGRLPIRESFRNLLSVFKRSKPTLKDLPPPRHPRAQASSPAKADEPRPRKPEGLTLQIPQSGQADSDKIVCISPVEAHTGKAGSLLYLSRISGSDLPPIWMSCSAQLHSTHILVTWDTPQGNPSPRLVPFTSCTDVHSLTPADLDPMERALLPAGQTWKVFEIIFEGRTGEKFAANSLTERATWVSAIWDAVLLAQENKPRSPMRTDGTYVPALNDAPPPSVPSNAVPAAASTTEAKMPPLPRSQQFPTTTNRELPALPTQTIKIKPPVLPRLDLRNLSVPSSSLSALPTPPTPISARKLLFVPPNSVGSPQRTQSASIRNLDQRSVVKERLAQLENGSPSPRPSTPLSPIPRRVVKSEILTTQMQMRRQGSTGSNFATSIFNAYLGPDSAVSGSPTSASTRSSGFHAIASRIGSPPPRPRTRVEDAGRGERGREEAPLSPASQYSVDDGKQEHSKPKPESGSTAAPTYNLLAIPRVPPARAAAPAKESTDRPAKSDSAVAPVLDDIQRGVETLKKRSTADGTNIVGIRTRVDEVLEELRRLPKAQLEANPKDTMAVMAKLEEVQGELKGHLSALHALVEGLRDAQKPGEEPHNGQDPSALVAVQEKLDKLLQLREARGGEDQDTNNFDATTTAQLAETVALLSDAREQRTAQMEQQTDTVRYLNELNTWLEAFVKHGTSQIEGVAAGIQQLCRDLGPIHDPQDQVDVPEGEEPPPPQGGLLSDIRLLLVQNQEREQNAAGLHQSVNGLLAAVQEDLRKNAEARHLLTTESVIGMIDRQRQDQERMLKALATELSNDIRGERLRFVEAMKEATAINVQIHVEEFKKELTREVLLMTQEVTRLQRERQGLEQQIADLFAFYAKQKQAGKVRMVAGIELLRQLTIYYSLQGGEVAQAQNVPAVPPPTFPGAIQPAGSIHRRPLPSPTPSPIRVR
ncbi:hypothetical protein LXA43DRAFT_881482 [Ganoderma leucocontextum]|nr:hypothetical protein LXA43DRAFT_881482 [Ganoderma leucocontextum]